MKTETFWKKGLLQISLQDNEDTKFQSASQAYDRQIENYYHS